VINIRFLEHIRNNLLKSVILCFTYPDFSTFFAGVFVVMGKCARIVFIYLFIYGLFNDAISSSDYVA